MIKKEIEGEYISSQIHLHKKYGGIYPVEAKRAHMEHIDIAVEETLKQSGRKLKDLSAIAVTRGPGLAMSLIIGFEKAKKLAIENNIPFIAINHLEAHCLMAQLSIEEIKYPYLVLLVSGGHTQILICEEVGKYFQLGGCNDDALGEAFDKVLRLLERGYQTGELDNNNYTEIELIEGAKNMHSGEILEKLAFKGNPTKYAFPEPLLRVNNCEFSYSGIKAAVKRTVKNIISQQGRPLDFEQVCDIAASFQMIAFQHVISRIKISINWVSKNAKIPCRTLVVSGGVARNLVLRESLENLIKSNYPTWKIFFPPLRFCTDNGVMVAWNGVEKFKLKRFDDPKSLDILARWPLDQGFDSTTIFPLNIKKK
eukprot:TRINITY_DN13269_c0_g1_i1.p1 TRINITY_DN13269_c0_g1~~TRINITY_DN13269_c0_g1_i1.p1  ORF type:complete len:368 (+),score=71.24 TRINITY_DN13269_c0_g1_i1:181-1284(+)